MKKNIKVILLIMVICSIMIISNYIVFERIRKNLLTDLNSIPANPAFNDENFYECIVDSYNHKDGPYIIIDPDNSLIGYDESLTDEQLNSILKVNCNRKNIQDVTGIEKLTEVTSISLVSNTISNIDLSHNPHLTSLNLSSNQLTTIDLSNNSNITNLNMYNNQLTNIDLRNNPNITDLNLSSNQFTTIDLSYNPNLISLNLYSNQLTTIDLSNNQNIAQLYLSNNQLTNIDLSNKPNLIPYYLRLSNNNLCTNQKYLYIGEEISLLSPSIIIDNNFNLDQFNYAITDDLLSTCTVNNHRIKCNETSSNLWTAIGSSSTDICNMNLTVLKLESDEYIINEENSSIYIGTDSEKDIKSKTNIDDAINIVLDKENNKLILKQENSSIKEFDTLRIDFGKYQVENKQIKISEEKVSYENFTNQINKVGVNYSIYKDDVEVTTGNIENGMQLRVSVDGNVIDTYEIIEEIPPKQDEIEIKNDLENQKETAKVADTGHNKSKVIRLIGILLFVIGTTIILVLISKKKNKKF